MQETLRRQQPLHALSPIVVAAMLALAVITSPFAAAQEKSSQAAHDAAGDVTDMQALRAAVKADKHAYVASTLALTSAEAKRFWPIYDAYQRSVEASSRRRVVALEGLLFHDKVMTNLAARNLVTELMAIDEADVKARHRLRNRLMRALPPVKAARYLQLEDKIQAVQDYDIASTVPLLH
jgi:Spy/CpxP family protein refolding chaperone